MQRGGPCGGPRRDTGAPLPLSRARRRPGGSRQAGRRPDGTTTMGREGSPRSGLRGRRHTAASRCGQQSASQGEIHVDTEETAGSPVIRPRHGPDSSSVRPWPRCMPAGLTSMIATGSIRRGWTQPWPRWRFASSGRRSGRPGRTRSASACSAAYPASAWISSFPSARNPCTACFNCGGCTPIVAALTRASARAVRSPRPGCRQPRLPAITSYGRGESPRGRSSADSIMSMALRRWLHDLRKNNCGLQSGEITVDI